MNRCAARLGRVARRLLLTSHESNAAESALGRNHPVARALSLQHALALQALVVSPVVVLGLAGTLLRVERAPVVLGVTGFVALALGIAICCARGVARDRTRLLIAEGGDAVVLRAVARERRRLASRKLRERLARSLEALLRDAQRAHELLPLARPLPGVHCLAESAAEIAQVAGALRSEHVRVQGVALVERLIVDGSRSPLYAGDAGRLHEELNRIRFLLGGHEPQAETPARVAA